MLFALSAPSAMALGLGITANAYFFFGNAALSEMGVVPIIANEEKRKRYALSTGKSSQIFDFFYHAGAVSSV